MRPECAGGSHRTRMKEGALQVGNGWCRGLEMGRSLVYFRKGKKASVREGQEVAERQVREAVSQRLTR